MRRSKADSAQQCPLGPVNRQVASERAICSEKPVWERFVPEPPRPFATGPGYLGGSNQVAGGLPNRGLLPMSKPRLLDLSTLEGIDRPDFAAHYGLELRGAG